METETQNSEPDEQHVVPGCTCDYPSEYNSETDPDHDRHELGCDLAPDVTGWNWYPHDGELEGGGVFVNPADDSCIYLLVKGYLCKVPEGRFK